MTKIVSDGRKKVFCTKCYECATDFEYQLSDVENVESVQPHIIGTRAVKCPTCGEYVAATLMTKEEQDKYFGAYFYKNNFGVC